MDGIVSIPSKDNLLPGQTWQNDVFLSNDVFYMKMLELLDDIFDGELFGRVVCSSCTVEFQKRGMPHLHMIFSLHVCFI